MDEDPDPELHRLRMFAEVGAESPLWTAGGGNMVEPDQLPISAALQDALADWADKLWPNLPRPSAQWKAEGRTLHARLVTELGPDFEVVLVEPRDPPSGLDAG